MSRWWKESEDDLATAIQTTAKTIYDSQSKLRQGYAKLLSVYEDKDIADLDGISWAEAMGALDREETRENLARMVVDTLTAKIGARRPRPRFLTSGNFELTEKAERRGLFVEGVYHQQRTYLEATQMFRDAAVLGTGLMKVGPDMIRREVCIERALVPEILVDYLDGKYCKPRSMFHTVTASRSVIRDAYGIKGNSIDNADMLDSGVKTKTDVDDPITVIEAWHLPSSPEAKDGVNVVCTTAGVLDRSDWIRERFPFLVWRYKRRMFGWHGFGLVEDIYSQQHNSDALNRVISMALNSMGIRIILPDGCEMDLDELTNEPGIRIARVKGGKEPIPWKDPGPAADIYNERDRQIHSAMQQSGVSFTSATSQVQSNLKSGVAIMEAKDSESERFRDTEVAWDWAMAVELPELVLDAAEDLGADPEAKKYAVRVPTGDGIAAKKITWGELAGDNRDDYLIQPWPASLLPREPAGRVEMIGTLMGMFPQVAPIFASFLRHPDVDAATALVSAPVDVVMADVKDLEKGEFISPEPFLDLNLAKMLVLANYQRAKTVGAREKVLEAHRQYLISLQNMIEDQQRNAALMAGQMSAGAAGMMAPGPEGGPPSPPSGSGMPPM